MPAIACTILTTKNFPWTSANAIIPFHTTICNGHVSIPTHRITARWLPQVKNYFNTAGFERWRKIYGETDEVNKVQMDIRKGHAQTVEKVLKWLDEEGGVEGTTFADAGCGTGGCPRTLGEWDVGGVETGQGIG